jgi:hypothetical protein
LFGGFSGEDRGGCEQAEAWKGLRSGVTDLAAGRIRYRTGQCDL